MGTYIVHGRCEVGSKVQISTDVLRVVRDENHDALRVNPTECENKIN